MGTLLDALATGTEREKTFAMRVIEEHLGTDHRERLGEIAAAEENAERKKVLTRMIEGLAKSKP